MEYKVVMLGNTGTGKTSIFVRAAYSNYGDDVKTTIAISYQVIAIRVDGETVFLHLWDTAGQERYRCLIPGYLRNASAVCVVASLDDDESIENIDYWINIVKEARDEIEIFVVINKIDLNLTVSFDRNVDSIREKLKSKYEKLYFVSAKTGENIDKLFDDIAKACYNLDLKLTSARLQENKKAEEEKSECC